MPVRCSCFMHNQYFAPTYPLPIYSLGIFRFRSTFFALWVSAKGIPLGVMSRVIFGQIIHIFEILLLLHVLYFSDCILLYIFMFSMPKFLCSVL